MLGSPSWLSLLLTAAAVVLAVYAAVWAVIVSLYAVDLALAAGCLGALAGLAIALFIGSGAAAGALLRLTRRGALRLKGCLVKKEEAA